MDHPSDYPKVAENKAVANGTSGSPVSGGFIYRESFDPLLDITYMEHTETHTPAHEENANAMEGAAEIERNISDAVEEAIAPVEAAAEEVAEEVEEAVTTVHEAQESVDETIREEAAAAAKKLGVEDFTPEIIDHLRNEIGAPAQVAAEEISETAEEAAVEVADELPVASEAAVEAATDSPELEIPEPSPVSPGDPITPRDSHWFYDESWLPRFLRSRKNR